MSGLGDGEAIRADVLSNGAPDFIVLSCVDSAEDWKDETRQTITFLMSSNAFEKYQSYSIFRYSGLTLGNACRYRDELRFGSVTLVALAEKNTTC